MSCRHLGGYCSSLDHNVISKTFAREAFESGYIGVGKLVLRQLATVRVICVGDE